MEKDRSPATRAKAIKASLVVKERKGGPVWYGVWRDSQRRAKMRVLGPAWLTRRPPERNPFVADGEGRSLEHEPRQESWRATWERRKGRAHEGYLTEQQAVQRLGEEVEAWEVEIDGLAERAAQGEQHEPDAPTLGDAVAAWLTHREGVKGARPSTLRDYRTAIAKHALASAHFAKPLGEITAGDVIRWRDELDGRRDEHGERVLHRRTINKTRMMLHGVFDLACRPVEHGGFGLPENPVRWAEPLGEDYPAKRDPLRPAEVLEVARVLHSGEHRTDRMRAGGEYAQAENVAARALEDERDAAAVVVMAFCGLRRGEVAALRWAHVRFDSSYIEVERSYGLGQETSTKGKMARTVPMPEQVAQALAKLGQREHFTQEGDLVFCGTAGEYMDGSALRRRFLAACRAAGIKRSTRLHDLRHSFTTEARQVFGADNVREWAGHKDARTAQRYAHARDQADAAERMSRYIEEAATPA